MTVKELREKLEELPECYDDCPVVTFQAEVEQVYNGSSDEIRFVEFKDFEIKRVHADMAKVRID